MNRTRTSWLFVMLWLSLPACAWADEPADQQGAPSSEEQIAVFEKHIRPLLTEHCLECHSSATKSQGGLNLDSKLGWTTGGDSGPAIVPGKPDESLLVAAIRYYDSYLQMPPKKKLSAAEIEAVEKWIRSGAADPRTEAAATAVKKQVGLSIEEGRRYWSFIPPHSHNVPAVQDRSWPSGKIDHFILAELEKASLHPASDADRESLVRRVYYDLIGLPPTSEQIDAFVKDAEAGSLEHLIDTLMKTPQFGERWGRHWLDVARFAESSGGGRTLLFKDAWRYRDYVIDAFNADMPFDQFLREQIAGDLLPATDPKDKARGIVASGFLVLGPTNYEEQDKAALRMDIIDEQLEAIGKGFMALTIGCARCHDHKFDPIPTRDYYALAGILRSTATLRNYTDNVAHWVESPLPLDSSEEQHYQALADEQSSLEKELKQLKKQSEKPTGTPDKPAKSIPIDSLPGIVIDDTAAKQVGAWESSQFLGGYVGQGYLHDDNSDKGNKAVSFIPKIASRGTYEVRLSYTPGPNRATNVPITVLHADGEHMQTINQKNPGPVDGVWISLGKFRFEAQGEGFVVISNAGTDGHVIVDAVQFLPIDSDGPDATAAKESATKPKKDAAKDGSDNKTIEARIKQLEKQIKAVQSQLDARPIAMAVHDAEIGDTEIRIRGLARNLGAKVPRGFLQVADCGSSGDFTEKESGRRQLADWLADPKHPLTARVYVNRVWCYLMGQGIVRTVDNFGVTGERPSHPELLDTLALDFVSNGWSTKKLIREIMLSRTYRMSVSAPSEKDPDNRLFAVANRRRLDAEQIRDAMLMVSGRLDETFGGPNINGGGAIDANTTAAQDVEYTYNFIDTRRSVYTPAFRNKRLELFEAFDFADINSPIGKRAVSTVSPQALYFMNHSFVMEQAEQSAKKLLELPADSDAQRLDEAYRKVIGRRPNSRERELTLEYLRGSADSTDEGRLKIWTQVVQSLFSSIDFRYLN